MKFQLPESLTDLSVEELKSLLADANTEAIRLSAIDDEKITDDELDEVDVISAARDALNGEISAREAAETTRRERVAAAKSKLSAPADEETDAETDEEPVESEEPGDEVPDDASELLEEEAVTASASTKVVKKVAPARQEPVVEKQPAVYAITASANVPDFTAGAELADMAEVAAAFVSKTNAFRGRRDAASLERHAVARISRRSPEFAITQGMDLQQQMDVLMAAASEKRLTGGSLTAAGGWCAPSETMYGFCELENPTGLYSLPEVTVTRGGINFTKGPQIWDILNDPNFGFIQTEAQAEAGTTKVCFELECPAFTDVRLDVIGWCFKVGILTASPAGWPELVRRNINLATLAFQIKVSLDTLSRVRTLIGAAVDYVEVGAATSDILDALVLQRLSLIEQFALADTTSVEVVLPQWVREFIRSDLSRRTGVDLLSVTDAYINSLFAVRRLAPQFVWGYQPVTVPPTAGAGTAFPTTLEALVYPAGSYVRGTNDVISLDAVYDSDGLSTNTYTAVFYEEATMVYNPCGGGRKVNISLAGTSDNVGVTGAATIGAPVVTP